MCSFHLYFTSSERRQMESKRFVTESSINYSFFHCCGDEDLYPFKCSHCGQIMVFCYECDILYPDLHRPSKKIPINSFYPDKHYLSCPACGHQFEYSFMKNAVYRASVDEWMQAGYQRLLSKSESCTDEGKS